MRRQTVFDADQGAQREIAFRMRDRHPTGSSRMAKLHMAAFLAHLEPSGRFDAPDRLTAVHTRTRPNAYWYISAGRSRLGLDLHLDEAHGGVAAVDDIVLHPGV